ncbi:MAG: TMEM175 family protein [Lactobacillus sp.]|jgi:uncharacterized membrane protein|nr:TMEM175 family protein [Lactobacillus sp.]MCH4068166.1 TMEM175 family protein [Lactobacillus sp.]MCI1304347.1 TMEM175 family protein [Lactobacillus sp.]MCI1330097.1 TMEM175 family protein [Lactobacillus sp.]MCI1360018.1 TMEM175 family protein [Lactobacillus sp.]
MKKDHGQFSDQFARDLKEHLATFNDGVIAIIITVMVLEIPAPQSDTALPSFLKAIGNYAVSFFIVASFWYSAHSTFASFEKANKRVMIADFCMLLALSLVPVMTKWIIQNPSQIALAIYGLVYALVEVFSMLILVAGNYERIRGRQLWKVALFRSFMFLIPLTILIIFIPKVTLYLYLIVPIVSLMLPERRRGEKHES